MAPREAARSVLADEPHLRDGPDDSASVSSSESDGGSGHPGFGASAAAKAIGLPAPRTGLASSSSASPRVEPARGQQDSLFRKAAGAPRPAAPSPRRDALAAAARKLARWASGAQPEPSCASAAVAGLAVVLSLMFVPLSAAAMRLTACISVHPAGEAVSPFASQVMAYALGTRCNADAAAANWALAAPMIVACTIGLPVAALACLWAASGSLEAASTRAWAGPLFLHTRYDEAYDIARRNGGRPINPWCGRGPEGHGASGGAGLWCDATGRAPFCPGLCLACCRGSGADDGDEGAAGGAGLGSVVPRCCGRRATSPLTLFIEPVLMGLRAAAVAAGVSGVGLGPSAQSLLLSCEAVAELLLLLWLHPYRTPLLNGVALSGAAVHSIASLALLGPVSGAWTSTDVSASAGVTAVVFASFLVPLAAALVYCGAKAQKRLSATVRRRRERAQRASSLAARQARQLERVTKQALRLADLKHNPMRDTGARRHAMLEASSCPPARTPATLRPGVSTHGIESCDNPLARARERRQAPPPEVPALAATSSGRDDGPSLAANPMHRFASSQAKAGLQAGAEGAQQRDSGGPRAAVTANPLARRSKPGQHASSRRS